MKKTLAIILTVAFVLSLGGAAFAQEKPATSLVNIQGDPPLPATDTYVNKFNQTIDGWTAFYVTGHVMVEVTPMLYDERGWYTGTYNKNVNKHRSLLWADVTVYDVRDPGEWNNATQTYYGDVKVYNDIGESNTNNPQGNMVGYAYFTTSELIPGGHASPTALNTDYYYQERVLIELASLYNDNTITPGSSPTADVSVINSLTVDHAITADASLDYKQLPDWYLDAHGDWIDKYGGYDEHEDKYYPYP